MVRLGGNKIQNEGQSSYSRQISASQEVVRAGGRFPFAYEHQVQVGSDTRLSKTASVSIEQQIRGRTMSHSLSLSGFSGSYGLDSVELNGSDDSVFIKNYGVSSNSSLQTSPRIAQNISLGYFSQEGSGGRSVKNIRYSNSYELTRISKIGVSSGYSVTQSTQKLVFIMVMRICLSLALVVGCLSISTSTLLGDLIGAPNPDCTDSTCSARLVGTCGVAKSY